MGDGRALLKTRATIVGAAALCFWGAACGGNDDVTSRTQVIFDTDWGPELVARKVALYVQMGGRYPEQEPGDYNLGLDAPSSHAVIANWPTPILFSGGKIGDEVITGTARLREATTAENPVHRAYLLARAPIATVEDLIERLMAKPPGAALSQDLQP